MSLALKQNSREKATRRSTVGNDVRRRLYQLVSWEQSGARLCEAYLFTDGEQLRRFQPIGVLDRERIEAGDKTLGRTKA